jgi:hypothetical protein
VDSLKSKQKRVIRPGITLLCKPCIGAQVAPQRCPILQCKEKHNHDCFWQDPFGEFGKMISRVRQLENGEFGKAPFTLKKFEKRLILCS